MKNVFIQQLSEELCVLESHDKVTFDWFLFKFVTRKFWDGPGHVLPQTFGVCINSLGC